MPGGKRRVVKSSKSRSSSRSSSSSGHHGSSSRHHAAPAAASSHHYEQPPQQQQPHYSEPAPAPAYEAPRRVVQPKPAAVVRRPPVTRAPPPAADDDDDDDDDYDDDDFDDYDDDDFEDFEEPPKKSPVSELQAAMQAENARAIKKTYTPYQSTAPKTSSYEKQSLRTPPRRSTQADRRGPGAGNISIMAAALPERDVNLTMSPKPGARGTGRSKRVKALKRLIKLSESDMQIFSQPPLPPYDLYLRTVRGGSIRQTQCQTNDDALTVASQTEKLEYATASMQFPDDIGFGSSGNKTTADAASNLQASLRLSKFLKSATQVVEALLEENLAGDTVSTRRQTTHKAQVSRLDATTTHIGSHTVTEGRRVTATCFPLARPNELIVCYAPKPGAKFSRPAASTAGAGAGAGAEQVKGPSGVGEALDTQGIVCVWDVHSASTPNLALMCPGTPVVCDCSPDRSHVIVAGTLEGSIAVWDLRESSNMHRSKASTQLKLDTGLRQPSYCTDTLATAEDVHCASICAIAAIPTSSSTSSHTKTSEDEKSSFQVVSLDDRGVVNVWVAVELHSSEWNVSEMDLGLGIGARVKLIKSSSVNIFTVPGSLPADSALAALGADMYGPGVSCLATLPDDPSLYLVGTNYGRIVHCSRFGEAPPPHSYYQPGAATVAVTAISVAPWNHKYFVAGYADGTVRLFDRSASAPLVGWADACGNEVVAVTNITWGDTRPSVFYVLDANGTLHVWDLLSNDRMAVLTLPAKERQSKQLALSMTSRVANHRPLLALTSQDGSAAVHALSDDLIVPVAEEEEQLLAKLTSIL